METPSFTVQVYKDATELSAAAVDLVMGKLLDQCMAAHGSDAGGRCSIALSGGSTPKRMYEIMAAKHKDVAESAFSYYFGDVRVVPDDSADSNFKMAHDALLHAFSPAASMVYAPNITLPPEECAASYAAVLQQTLPSDPTTGAPTIDIVLLGLGPDGHTASMFPGTAAAAELSAPVVATMPNEGVKPFVPRVTVTTPVIHAARHVVVLAAGAEKKWVMENIMTTDPNSGGKGQSVARLLRGCRGQVHFLLDVAAAPGSGA